MNTLLYAYIHHHRLKLYNSIYCINSHMLPVSNARLPVQYKEENILTNCFELIRALRSHSQLMQYIVVEIIYK